MFNWRLSILEIDIIIYMTCYAYENCSTKCLKDFPHTHVSIWGIFWDIQQENELDIETLKEPRIFYHFVSCNTQCQNEWPRFWNRHLTTWNSQKWYSGDILRTSCFYSFDLGLLFLKIGFFEAKWNFIKHMWSMSTSS